MSSILSPVSAIVNSKSPLVGILYSTISSMAAFLGLLGYFFDKTTISIIGAIPFLETYFRLITIQTLVDNYSKLVECGGLALFAIAIYNLFRDSKWEYLSAVLGLGVGFALSTHKHTFHSPSIIFWSIIALFIWATFCAVLRRLKNDARPQRYLEKCLSIVLGAFLTWLYVIPVLFLGGISDLESRRAE